MYISIVSQIVYYLIFLIINSRALYTDATDTLEGFCTISLYEYYEKVLFGNDVPIVTINLGQECLSCKACSLKGMPCVIHHLGSVHTTYTYII